MISEINDLIEKSRSMRTKIDQDFLEYQNKVELEFSSFLKETKEYKIRIEALSISSSQLEDSLDNSLEGERDGTESCASSYREESSISFSTSVLHDEASVTDDLESSLADDESQETALNHYHNFQTRKEVKRRIRFSKSNMLRAKTLNNLSSLYQHVASLNGVILSQEILQDY